MYNFSVLAFLLAGTFPTTLSVVIVNDKELSEGVAFEFPNIGSLNNDSLIALCGVLTENLEFHSVAENAGEVSPQTKTRPGVLCMLAVNLTAMNRPISILSLTHDGQLSNMGAIKGVGFSKFDFEEIDTSVDTRIGAAFGWFSAKEYILRTLLTDNVVGTLLLSGYKSMGAVHMVCKCKSRPKESFLFVAVNFQA